ncbi:MAG: ATP-binding protein [Daejeonella sp.]
MNINIIISFLIKLPKGVLKRQVILILFTVFAVLNPALAQNKQLDSLVNRLNTATLEDTSRVNLLNDISFKNCFIDLKEVYSNAQKALVLSQKINYTNGIGGAYKNIGLYYMFKDANPMALDYFDKSYKFYKNTNNKVGASKALNNSGYFYSLIKDYQEGIKYYRQAEAQLKDINEPRLTALLLGNIGNNYEALGQLDTAYFYYQKMLALALLKENRDLLGNSYSNLASYELKKGRYRQAIQLAERVMEVHKTNENHPNQELSDINMILGKAYFQLGNYDKSQKFFEISNNIAKRVEYSEIIIENYHNFYQLDSIRGDSKSALNNFLKYSELRDSLTNANKNKRIAFYQIKFQSEKSEAENQKLRKEEEKNKAYISSQKTRVITLVVSLIVILIAVFILSRVNRRMESKNKIINQQNKNLEEANLVKNTLFSVIAHDLRTPFSHIIPMLEMIENDQMDQSDFKELVPLIKVNFLDNLLLVDNLLLWAKSQLDGFKVKPVVFNVHELGQELTVFFKEFSSQKNIVIENRLDSNLEIFADRETIKIVLRNLISNAIKFTREGGIIQLSNKESDKEAIISIKDSGIGIKRDDLGKLFSFTNYTTLGTSNEKGTGMGLKICKDFIELNKGSISVDSTENVGTTFSILLPLPKTQKASKKKVLEIV